VTARWVCAVGGAEFLLHAVGEPDKPPFLRSELIQEMIRWNVRYGDHPPFPPDAFAGLRPDVELFLGWMERGSLWWGDPRGWIRAWPEGHAERLAAERELREHVTRPLRPAPARPPVRGRRR
jgi:hypothetical protein